MKADLHCHSTVSDGLLPPAEVARRAADRGLELWSLTDHDDVAGLAEARARASEPNAPPDLAAFLPQWGAAAWACGGARGGEEMPPRRADAPWCHRRGEGAVNGPRRRPISVPHR